MAFERRGLDLSSVGSPRDAVLRRRLTHRSAHVAASARGGIGGRPPAAEGIAARCQLAIMRDVASADYADSSTASVILA